ncbi:MAG: Hsp20/alpha crystallin family protein [Calditrichaeota bacterium]|nr:Hsp20/alpha crystallin family protein [Calditrichota bacterium]RQW07221.1 MAG: Hsp20/alpha crystallin family protein [Calditrichota bacterium]
MEDLKKQIYKEFNTVEGAENLEVETFQGKRPILLISDFSFSPPTDVWETEENVMVIMEISGLSLKDFAIRYRDGYLVIEGKRHDIREKDRVKIIKYYKKEIDTGTFRVRIKMNTRIMREKIRASYDNGLLTVTLPKIPVAGSGGNQDKPIPVNS